MVEFHNIKTTSTEQSGLFSHILPLFTRETGIAVRVVALGTGQALDVGRRGDADVVLVHDRAAEERFVAEGLLEGQELPIAESVAIMGALDEIRRQIGVTYPGES